MSAVMVACVGLRIEIHDDAEIELLEARTHEMIVLARTAGLQFYWGNFGAPADRYVLFVGRLIGKLGPDESSHVHLTIDDLLHTIEDVATRLRTAGSSHSVNMFLEYQPD